ncbi:MAG TPA: phosphotransferase [Levilinea sp.]|nr:phosphotransferase [Levilinea sp.]
MNSPDWRNQTPVRILVVDNESIVRSGAVKNLEHWGFIAFCAEGMGPELLKDALIQARRHRCHLALVDLRLLDDYDVRDVSGLELIEALEPTRTIIVTASTDSRMSTNALELGALGFASKSEGPQMLHAELEKALKKLHANRGEKEIHWPEGLASTSVTRLLAGDEAASAAGDQADDVLVRLFPQQTVLKIEPLKDSSLTGAGIRIRPHSLVAQVRADANQPVIIKLAQAARISQEIENYETLVRNMLEGRYCPQLQERCVLWDIGGASYTLLGANSIHTFSSIYAASSAADLEKPLRLLLGETWPKSYAGTRQPLSISLFEAYRRLWSKDWYKQLPAWPRPRPELPEPSTWLLQHTGLDGAADASHLPGQFSAVCHGDLHGDNLLVDHNGVPWVIDFERTGQGPALADFVELEVDILNRLAGFEDGEQAAFERLCRVITQPVSLVEILPCGAEVGERSQKALALVQVLRQTAAQVSGSQDPIPYLWGLLFSTLFYARLLHKQAAAGGQIDRTYYLASQICTRLGGSYPLPA